MGGQSGPRGDWKKLVLPPADVSLRRASAVPWNRSAEKELRLGIENPVHLIFIAVVALLVLGPKRLPELARALGRGIREFREAMSGESVGGVARAADPPADARIGADEHATVDPARTIPSRDAPDRRPL